MNHYSTAQRAGILAAARELGRLSLLHPAVDPRWLHGGNTVVTRWRHTVQVEQHLRLLSVEAAEMTFKRF